MGEYFYEDNKMRSIKKFSREKPKYKCINPFSGYWSQHTKLLSQIAMKDVTDSPQLLPLFGPGLTVNSLPASSSPDTTL